NCIVIWEISLQYHLSRSLPSPRPPCNLGKQLKGAFCRPKIRKPQSGVGPDNTHERDPVDVMSFGDHLGAHQQIEFAFVQRVEGALEVVAAAHRVAIQSADARLRKHAVHYLFQLLRASPEEINILTATMHAR